MIKKTHLGPRIAIIAALDEQNGIGRNGGLLCHLPADLKYFKEKTSGHSIIMGRKTYESLPKGALPHRTNIVITSGKAEKYPGCLVARSLDEALTYAKDEELLFIIGGGQLYRTSLHMADVLYITRIHHLFEDADTFFPDIDSAKWELVEEDEHDKDEKHPFRFSFQTFLRKEKIHTR